MKKVFAILFATSMILLTACKDSDDNSISGEVYITTDESVSEEYGDSSAATEKSTVLTDDTYYTGDKTEQVNENTTVGTQVAQNGTEQTETTKKSYTTSKPSVTTKVTTKTTTKATTNVTTSKPQNNVSSADFATEVARLVNVERNKAGLSPLTFSTQISKACQVRSNEIMNKFSHTRPDGSSCFTVLKEYNVSYMASGENIAYGQKAPQEVMTSWMNSEGHRANIMSDKFGTIGVAAVKNTSNGMYYWTQLFTD